MKVAHVTWADAFVSETNDGQDHFPQNSVGYLVQNNKHSIKLAQSYNEDGPAELLTVPRAYVLNMCILGNVRVPRKRKK